MDTQVSQGSLQRFSERMGSWRPDFLVENLRPTRQGTTGEENFAITEINARFSFNGFMHEAYGQQALDETLHDISSGTTELISATDPSEVFGGTCPVFSPDDGG